jgi:hypothetical protein
VQAVHSPFRPFPDQPESARRRSRRAPGGGLPQARGRLHLAPQEQRKLSVLGPPAYKISKAGNPYASATVREGSGEATRWRKVFVFNEADRGNLALVDGEPIAVAGEFDAEIYAPAGGEARVTWRIRADAVLSVKKPKARKSARAVPLNNRHPAASPAHPNAPGGVIDEPLPF